MPVAQLRGHVGLALKQEFGVWRSRMAHRAVAQIQGNVQHAVIAHEPAGGHGTGCQCMGPQ